MPDHRIPKIVFYSELQQGFRPRGRPKKRYKDSLKDNLRSTLTTGSRQLPLGARGVRPAAQEWWATKISELLVSQRRQRRKDLDAGEQQRSAWCPIWELPSSTDQRFICLSKQETSSSSSFLFARQNISFTLVVYIWFITQFSTSFNCFFNYLIQTSTNRL